MSGMGGKRTLCAAAAFSHAAYETDCKERLTTDRERLERVVKEHSAGKLEHLSYSEITIIKTRIAELDTKIAEDLKAG